MQIQLLVDALQAFPQFLPYIAIYNEKTPMLARTYDAFSQYLLDQFTNMPKEASTRGGHADNSYKGKGKKGKNKGKKGKRKWKWNDDDSHQGHRAEKRARSISPSPSATPSVPATLLSQSVRQNGYGVDKVDTRSLKSHRSSALLVSNARAQKTRESFKQDRDRSVREKEGGKTQPNFSPP